MGSTYLATMKRVLNLVLYMIWFCHKIINELIYANVSLISLFIQPSLVPIHHHMIQRLERYTYFQNKELCIYQDTTGYLTDNSKCIGHAATLIDIFQKHFHTFKNVISYTTKIRCYPLAGNRTIIWYIKIIYYSMVLFKCNLFVITLTLWIETFPHNSNIGKQFILHLY